MSQSLLHQNRKLSLDHQALKLYRSSFLHDLWISIQKGVSIESATVFESKVDISLEGQVNDVQTLHSFLLVCLTLTLYGRLWFLNHKIRASNF